MTNKSATTPSFNDFHDPTVLAATTGQARGGVRLPDGRALHWAGYGSSRGVPCILLPDTGSSSLAPHWLMHEITPPAEVRLLALDRPGVGHWDPVSLVDRLDPVEDLYHLVNTLAVGRVAVIGVGQGASDALAFAARHPTMLSTVLAVSPRITAEPASRHYRWPRRGWSAAATVPVCPVARWLRAAGRGADLASERTWERATRRMDPRSARVLGQRWQEPAFRQGLADDANQTAGSWTAPLVVSPPVNWEKVNCQVPVRI